MCARKEEIDSWKCFTNLMEGETLGTDPRVPGVVLAVVEDLAIEIFVGIIAGLLVDAVESALGQKQGETVGLFLLFLELLSRRLPGGGTARRRTNANGRLRVIATVDRRCRLAIQLLHK